jgi:hypothetical protein
MKIFDNTKRNYTDGTLTDVFGNKFEEAMYLLETYTDDDVVIKKIDNNDDIRFVADFYGLLENMNISSDLHYIMLILNGLVSPMDYNGEPYIKLIDPNVLTPRLESFINSAKKDTIATI